jgi:VWFA-related protein
MRLLLALFLASLSGLAATKVIVTVVEQKTAKPVSGLQAADFSVLDDKTPKRVESVEPLSGPVDVMLLVDSSLVGPSVQPLAADLIDQLAEKQQMALVAFDASVNLIQDFTSSRDTLKRALSNVKFGNSPYLLDALFAAIEGGFHASTFRRAIVLLTSGFEGPSRMQERDVVRLARRNGVSIFPVYLVGAARGLLENLARQTGGATFNLGNMSRDRSGPPARRIFNVLGAGYTLSLTGNLSLGEKVKVEVKRPEKLQVSALPLD